MRNYEFGTFLKNRVFHKNANTPSPLTKFQSFKIIQITRNHEKLDIHCKLTLVFVSSIGGTSKTSTTRDIFQKNSFFQNFVKMKLSTKIGNSTSRDSEMLYILFNNSLLWRIMNLGHFGKIEFFAKRQNPLDEISEFRKNSNYSKSWKTRHIL
jgi:hypothetical protein